MRLTNIISLVLLACLFAANPAMATLVITFTDGDTLEGDVVNSTAGPYTDPATSQSGTITTTSLLPNGVLNPNAGSLGINATGTDTAGSFDLNESWSFKWDRYTEFAGIAFGTNDAYATSDRFSVASSDWIGLSRTPGTGVTFTSGTGTFEFDNNVSGDSFAAAALGGVLPLSQGVSMTITLIAGVSSTVSNMSFNITAIPEPGAVLLGSVICGVLGLRIGVRQLKKKLLARG